MAEATRVAALVSACLAALMAVSQILFRRHQWRNLYLATVLATLSGIQLVNYLNVAAVALPAVVAYANSALIYLVGPSVLAYFRASLLPEFDWSWRIALTFLPFLLISGLMIAIWLIDASLFRSDPLGNFAGQPIAWPDKLVMAGFFFNSAFLFLVARDGLSGAQLRNVTRQKVTLVFILVVSVMFLVTGGAIATYLSGSLLAFQISVLALAAIVLALFFMRESFPQFFIDLEESIESGRYKVSQIGSLNLTKVERSLNQVMQGDRLYLEEGLTLKQLAASIGVQGYQLSEYLNGRLGLNFAAFVNGYRVREAERMLRETPDASVLSIAYRCGFSSKASFNLAFKKISGQTPRDFLRKIARESSEGSDPQ